MLRDLFSLFPAYAGVIPWFLRMSKIATTFPRIRGGDPGMLLVGAAAAAAFPRIRGGDPLFQRVGGEVCDFSPHTRG